MKRSETKNRTQPRPYALVELGDVLLFQQMSKAFVVDSFDERGRPFSGETDLFELDKLEQAIVLEQ